MSKDIGRAATTGSAALAADPRGGRTPDAASGSSPDLGSRGVSTTGLAGNEGRRRGRFDRNRPLWMMLPGGLLMVILILVPVALGFYISFLDLDQYTLRQWIDAPFIGLANYVEAITETDLFSAVWLSVSYSLIAMLISIPIGVAAAVATQNAFKGRGVARSFFLIPYILPTFVVATVWRTMFQPDGVIDETLGSAGIDFGLALNGPGSYWTLVFVTVWASWPFVYLLALAGLQTVDHEVHEAAAIDGALWWTKLRYVVFPYLKGPISLAFIIGMLHHINAFTLPFVLFGLPAPQDVNVLPILTYQTSFVSFRFGLSAAMAVMSLILIAIPLFIYLRAVKLDSDSSPGGRE